MTPRPEQPATKAGRALLEAGFPEGEWWPGFEEDEAAYRAEILAIEREAAEDAVDNFILAEQARKDAGTDWRANSTPLAAAAALPDVGELAAALADALAEHNSEARSFSSTCWCIDAEHILTEIERGRGYPQDFERLAAEQAAAAVERAQRS